MSIVAVGQITIADVNDGLNATLTQESYVIATDANGAGGDYSGAATTISVRTGVIDSTAGWTITANAAPGVVGNLVDATYTVASMVVDTGYVDLTASRTGFPSLTARFNVTKARQGVVGPGLVLTASASGFTFTDGIALPEVQNIAVRALRQNTNIPVLFYTSNGVLLETSLGAMAAESSIFGLPMTSDGEVCYVSLADFGASDQFYITAVSGDATAVIHLLKINHSTAQAGATRNIFRGDYAAGVSYALGDIAVKDGTSWVCLVQHYSSGANLPPALPTTSNVYWAQYAAKGDRGTMQAAVTTAGSVWVDAQAQAAIVAAGGVTAQRGDVVTLYNSAAGFSQTRVFTTGGNWAILAAFFGGDVLVDGTVVSSKVAAEAIQTLHLAAGSVVASKMKISDATNIYPDFDLVDLAFYSTPNLASYTFLQTAISTLGLQYFNIATAAANAAVRSGWFAIDPATEYLASAAAFMSTATGGSGTTAVYFERGSVDASGVVTLLTSTLIAQRTDSTDTTPIATTVITGATERRGRFVTVRLANGTAYGRAAAFKLLKKYTGSLIVDGTIESNHVASNSIKTLHLDAEAVVASKMKISGALNNYPDFDMVDNSFYASSTSSSYATVGTTGESLGQKYLNIPYVSPGTVDAKVETKWFNIESDTEYLINGSAWVDAAGASAKLEFETATADLYGNAVTSLGLTTVRENTAIFANSESNGFAVVYTGATARKGRFVMTRLGAVGTGGAAFGAFRVRLKTTAALIVDGAIKAEHLDVDSVTADSIGSRVITSDHIAVGGIEAENMNINGLLTLNDLTAGFSLGKNDANDTADGLYMGRTLKAGGGVGFGFNMGKTDANGVKRFIRHTSDDGFQIVNANYGLLTDLTSSPAHYTTNQTVYLTDTGLSTGAYIVKTLNLSVIGGGAGGWGSYDQNAGTAGGDTVVQLFDGATYTGISWTGAGAPITGAVEGSGGDDGLFGKGGESAYKIKRTGTHSTGETYYYYTTTAATNATPYGSGGGGGCTSANARGGGFKGGAAAPALLISGYDLGALGLTAPKLVITIGAGGIKNFSGSGYGAYGTDGTQGKVIVDKILSDVVPCGVIPLYPTATGSFSKAANATGGTVFPDLGVGMWVLWVTQGVSALSLDGLKISSKGAIMSAGVTNSVTFIADIRPEITVGSTNSRTINYAFYKMKAG